jgi:hypothetical protein
MNNFLTPDAEVNEYVIAIVPHEDLQHRILYLRKMFNEEFSVSEYSSKPQIQLVRFSQRASMESKIIRRLLLISMSAQPFKIEFSGFDNIPGHTIFLNVSAKNAFQEMVKKIRTEAQQFFKMDDQKPHFILEPRINIASRLQPWQFEKGWLKYSNVDFKGSFIADNILLLKRKQGDRKYIPVHKFSLMDLKSVPQGNLFM